MKSELAELWRFRDLLRQLVYRDLRVRYKNSRFGFFWSIMPPLMQVAVITFVFTRATNTVKIPNYSAYVLVAMIPWTYFSTAILDSSQSILIMYGVIKKVYLPREIIPLSNAISNFIHFLLSWSVFFIYWYVVPHGHSRPPLLPSIVWFPYLILVQFMLVTGLSLLVACLNVFYEDVKYIVTILLQLGLFLFPIMILAEQVVNNGLLKHLWGGLGLQIYMNNPLTALINGYRKSILESPPPVDAIGPTLPLDPQGLLIAGMLSFLILVGSYWYFNRRKWQFVERP